MEILTQVINYVKNILGELNERFCFHSVEHTYEVVEASKIIAAHCDLKPIDRELVLISCWFYDICFSISPFNHECHGGAIAQRFLELKHYQPNRIDKIIGCIRATRLPQKPSNLIESVVCDADMFYLSTKEYWGKNQLLKNEKEHISNNIIRNDQWCHENLNFLSQHQYHTEYGKKVLAKRKQANLNQNVQMLEVLKTS